MTPTARLYSLGMAMGVTSLAFARVANTVGGTAYLITLAIAAAIYLLVIRELTVNSLYARRTVLVCLLMGTAWQTPFFIVKPGPQDDVLRYVWDGRLQRLGFNPYTAIPSDPALASLHTVETRELNNPDVPSPYPAGAQLFFRAVTAVSESAWAFKVVLTVCNLAIIAVLFYALGGLGQQAWVLAYAWHPLLITCVYYNTHIDVLGILLLLISVVALQRDRRMVAAIAFGLAVAVKVLPIVLIPLYWRRIRWRDALVAALIVGLLYVPFLGYGTLPTGSVSAFVQRFRFNDPIFVALEKAMRPQVAAGLAVVLGLATAVWMRVRDSKDRWESWAWPMAVALLCAPVVYPWYLLWLAPFCRMTATFPLMVWSLSILSVFFVWHWYALGNAWEVPGWVLLFEFVPVVVAVVVRLNFRDSILGWRKRLA